MAQADRRLSLAMGLPAGKQVEERENHRRRPASCGWVNRPEGGSAGRYISRTDQTRHLPLLPPFLCHAPAWEWIRYSDGSGTSGPCRCQDHNDLYPCPQPGLPVYAAPWTDYEEKVLMLIRVKLLDKKLGSDKGLNELALPLLRCDIPRRLIRTETRKSGSHAGPSN